MRHSEPRPRREVKAQIERLLPVLPESRQLEERFAEFRRRESGER